MPAVAPPAGLRDFCMLACSSRREHPALGESSKARARARVGRTFVWEGRQQGWVETILLPTSTDMPRALPWGKRKAFSPATPPYSLQVLRGHARLDLLRAKRKPAVAPGADHPDRQ